MRYTSSGAYSGLCTGSIGIHHQLTVYVYDAFGHACQYLVEGLCALSGQTATKRITYGETGAADAELGLNGTGSIPESVPNLVEGQGSLVSCYATFLEEALGWCSLPRATARAQRSQWPTNFRKRFQ